MRISLAFITGTTAASPLGASTADRAGGAHELELLGYERTAHKLYFLEHYRDASGDLPQLYYMYLRGSQVGRMCPVPGWYEGATIAIGASADTSFGLSEFWARVARLKQHLVPVVERAEHPWRLSTRVAKRRALRLFPDTPPIRKFVLQLRVRAAADEHASRTRSIGARLAVTAYLRPRAELQRVFEVPGEPFDVAIVSYVGVPYEVGYHKHAAVLLPR